MSDAGWRLLYLPVRREAAIASRVNLLRLMVSCSMRARFASGLIPGITITSICLQNVRAHA